MAHNSPLNDCNSDEWKEMIDVNVLELPITIESLRTSVDNLYIFQCTAIPVRESGDRVAQVKVKAK